MLTKNDIEEYQKVYKKVYGEEISYSEALEQGTRLLNFFKVICKPTENYQYNNEKLTSKYDKRKSD